MMERIMKDKFATWDEQHALGRYASALYPSIDKKVPCVNGVVNADPDVANYAFRCNNIDLYNFKSHADLGSTKGQGSSSWGWTSPDGREFVAIGQSDGAAFAEITKEGKLVYLGRLPQYSVPAIWREIRGFNNFMVIGSEAKGHNIQIFDMTKLLSIDPESPKTFNNRNDLTGLFKGLPVGRTHNVVTNPESGWAYAVGAEPRNSTCRSGLIFIDMKDPTNPTSPGCAAQGGYVHDAQCILYKGPDTKYVGREICYGYNENAITIYDVTDKTAPTIISRTSYEGVAYAHQGWVLDPSNQEYLIMDDEYDEVLRRGLAKDGKPVTYIWNIKSLAKPILTGHYKGSVMSVDHNQYIYNGFSYQSNYASGFRVLDVSSIPSDPTGKSVKEVGFFDVYPEDDKSGGGGKTSFVGSWSSYANFKSGFIYVNTIERGGFVVRVNDKSKRAVM
ncbi:hypothetical protein EJ08DRAFT_634579 [Tothia fuscella]|uniref:Uncharacterized protein n=1 Tax=Tothia fuscella TaxID=1048955 RepID=A0A9P4NRD3_9PEZI|nr:hypothetical protein EJ08DRAFT_634579 [Tothia fuscella]